MSISTAQQYVIRAANGELICPRCDIPKIGVVSVGKLPTYEERVRHIIEKCSQPDAVDLEHYQQLLDNGDL
jgi:hypothetical protein